MSNTKSSVAMIGLALFSAGLTAEAADITYSNTAPIAINDNGPANPYPSTINVSGASGTVTGVTVSLLNASHSWTSDVDVMLVSPTGQQVILMSGVGGSGDLAGNYTFMAGAPAMATSAPGTYSPTNNEGTGALPAPAPANSGNTDMSVFNGASPNGTWSLFVSDDAGADVGNIAGGWEITISGIEAGPVTTCASEGYTGTKLNWCKIICESESSAYTIDTYLRRWINRYHDLPYCALEEEAPELPPEV